MPKNVVRCFNGLRMFYVYARVLFQPGNVKIESVKNILNLIRLCIQDCRI
jgi:hypothetical protein